MHFLKVIFKYTECILNTYAEKVYYFESIYLMHFLINCKNLLTIYFSWLIVPSLILEKQLNVAIF